MRKPPGFIRGLRGGQSLRWSWIAVALGLSACLLSPVEDLPARGGVGPGSETPPATGGTLGLPGGNDGGQQGGAGGEAGTLIESDAESDAESDPEAAEEPDAQEP